jgi:hypothetical protein
MYEDLDRNAVGGHEREESKTVFPFQQTKGPDGSCARSGEKHGDSGEKSTS